MTNITLDIRANGTIVIIDGYSKAKTLKGIIKDLNKEMIKRGYNDLSEIVNDNCSLNEEINYINSKESKPFASSDNHYTYDIEEIEDGNFYVSHSFVM